MVKTATNKADNCSFVTSSSSVGFTPLCLADRALIFFSWASGQDLHHSLTSLVNRVRQCDGVRVCGDVLGLSNHRSRRRRSKERCCRLNPRKTATDLEGGADLALHSQRDRRVLLNGNVIESLLNLIVPDRCNRIEEVLLSQARLLNNFTTDARVHTSIS